MFRIGVHDAEYYFRDNSATEWTETFPTAKLSNTENFSFAQNIIPKRRSLPKSASLEKFIPLIIESDLARFERRHVSGVTRFLSRRQTDSRSA